MQGLQVRADAAGFVAQDLAESVAAFLSFGARAASSSTVSLTYRQAPRDIDRDIGTMRKLE